MRRKKLAFVVIMLGTAFSLVAIAQPKKPAGKPAATQTGKKPAAEAGAENAPLATREERPQPVAAPKADAGGGGIVEAKTLDGGAKVFRFGEVEVEGRLKSPQIVYFLRRVRAEFAAGDLGHRTFMRELSETRNENSF